MTVDNNLKHISLKKNSYSTSFQSYSHSDPSYLNLLSFATVFRKKTYSNCNMQSKVKAVD